MNFQMNSDGKLELISDHRCWFSQQCSVLVGVECSVIECSVLAGRCSGLAYSNVHAHLIPPLISMCYYSLPSPNHCFVVCVSIYMYGLLISDERRINLIDLGLLDNHTT